MALGVHGFSGRVVNVSSWFNWGGGVSEGGSEGSEGEAFKRGLGQQSANSPSIILCYSRSFIIFTAGLAEI